MNLMTQSIFERENSTPGMPEQKEIARVETKCYAYLINFIHKTRDVPQIRKVGLIAIMRAKLIVVVELNACGRKIAVARLEVLVRGPGAAVQQ